jgi:hypothetical protein
MQIAGTMQTADAETVSNRASLYGARPTTRRRLRLHSLCGSSIRRHSNIRHRQAANRSINPRRLR